LAPVSAESERQPERRVAHAADEALGRRVAHAADEALGRRVAHAADEALGRQVARAANGALKRRVAHAAEEALARQGLVTPIDVLIGLGWLHPVHLDPWRQRRVSDLEQLIQVGPEKVALALSLLDRWGRARGLTPSEGEYLARSRTPKPLRFSAAGDPAVERAFRTQWLAPELSDRQRARRSQRQSRAPELVVVWPLKDFTCAACGTEHSGLLIMEDAGPLCLECAEMDHLVFLPSGNAALTRRAKAASRLWAVVVRFSRARRRYERQGLLVEESALEQAEADCLADEEARARRRERDAARRAEQDLDLARRMAEEIRRLLPGCPPERAEQIAAHAAARGSGRIGRTAAGRALDPRAIELAVAASVRHRDTPYDELLMSGVERDTARAQVRELVTRILDAWRLGGQ
jgi:hypothetical protein